jgi:hypothetical protein
MLYSNSKNEVKKKMWWKKWFGVLKLFLEATGFKKTVMRRRYTRHSEKGP